MPQRLAELQRTLRQLISQSRPEQVIDRLLALTQEPPFAHFQNAVSQQSAAYQKWKTDGLHGILTHDEESRTIQKINLALLQIIDELGKPIPEASHTPPATSAGASNTQAVSGSGNISIQGVDGGHITIIHNPGSPAVEEPKRMTLTPPLLYLAFANHQDHPLQNLVTESREVYRLLHPRAQEGHYQLHREDFAELDTIAHYLATCKDQVRLFHFGGHASSQSLLLRDLEARSAGIAAMLKQQQHLALVFLNGCSTKGQVEYLLELGVPAVIATSAPVNDDLASRFAVQFYQALAAGHTIREAFDMASAYLQARGDTGIHFFRGIVTPKNAQMDAQHWGLYALGESALRWTLPDQPLNLLDMMDPASLAAAVIAALTPYLVKGGEELAQGIGKDLWEQVKKPFKSDADKKKLEELKTKPEDAKTQGKVEGKLEELLAEDTDLAAQLNELLSRLPKSDGKTNTMTVTGDGNTSLQDVSGSTININTGK
ncbi:MAG: hypothetical protein KIPDCIKN_00643 [Haliscomenobacter sp.]|nr:hypothetical protein [Haliscomenobacter sp.]